MTKYFWALCALCAALSYNIVCDGCVYQACDCSFQYVHCEQKQLTSLPAMTPTSTNYVSLDLDDNLITNIPAGSLPPNLTAIYFTGNPIINISDSAFDDSASSLETLTFSSFRFTRIPDAFLRLKVLKSLDMRNANIQDWNDGVMNNIGQTLTTLNLENIGNVVYPNWFKYFSRLTDLSITGGLLFHSISDDAFDNVTDTLVTLSISNTDLTVVPKAFSRFKVLQKLSLDNNKLSDVTWLPHASKLVWLSLKGNMISDAVSLSNTLHPLRDSIDYLDASFNRLTAFPNITFLNLVGTMDFSNNRMSDPYSGGLAPNVPGILLSNNFFPAIPSFLKTIQWLPELYLFYNSIKQLHAADFPNSTKMVELGFNLVTELTDTSFPANSMISSVNLNNNPIVSISIGAFANLGQLTELDLKGTRLTRLPLALSSLTSVFSVDMTDSANLICTCQEKDLQNWVISLGAYTVLGNCGLMAIYDFYTQISPSC